MDDPAKLGAEARKALADPTNDLFVSSATVWELAIKVGLRKLQLSDPYRLWMNQAIAILRAAVIPITIEHAEQQLSLPLHHRDPFDRLLIAQAIVESASIISSDVQFDAYGINRVWS